MSHPWDDFRKPKEVVTPPRVVGDFVFVRNYYTFRDIELDQAIYAIRSWFIDSPNRKDYAKASLALEVALCAKELEHDAFVDLVIDTLW